MKEGKFILIDREELCANIRDHMSLILSDCAEDIVNGGKSAWPIDENVILNGLDSLSNSQLAKAAAFWAEMTCEVEECHAIFLTDEDNNVWQCGDIFYNEMKDLDKSPS
jgi:hypothetical protein